MPVLLDGKKVRDAKKSELTEKIAALSPRPHLIIIQVGEREESSAYIRQKKLFGESIGCQVTHTKFPETVSEDELLAEIEKLNSEARVHGIIVQLPVPAHIASEKVFSSILPQKDVDGLHPINQKLLAENNPDAFVPATARGVMTLLDFYNIPIDGKKATVIGRSVLVGKPIAQCLQNRGAFVTVCHRGTSDLAAETKPADILVVAAGVPHLIGARHVSPGQAVIDVGINLVSGEKLEEELPKKKLVGDVEYDAVAGIVGAISPVPGGVGPMTVLSLFENLVEAYYKK